MSVIGLSPRDKTLGTKAKTNINKEFRYLPMACLTSYCSSELGQATTLDTDSALILVYAAATNSSLKVSARQRRRLDDTSATTRSVNVDGRLCQCHR